MIPGFTTGSWISSSKNRTCRPRALAIMPRVLCYDSNSTVLRVTEALKSLMVRHRPERWQRVRTGSAFYFYCKRHLQLFHSTEQAKKDEVPLRYAHNGFTIKPNSVQGSPGNHLQASLYNWFPGLSRRGYPSKPRRLRVEERKLNKA